MCNKIIDVKVRERWENVFLVFSVDSMGVWMEESEIGFLM